MYFKNCCIFGLYRILLKYVHNKDINVYGYMFFSLTDVQLLTLGKIPHRKRQWQLSRLDSTSPAQDSCVQMWIKITSTASKLNRNLQQNHAMFVTAETMKNHLHDGQFWNPRNLRASPFSRSNRAAYDHWVADHLARMNEEWGHILLIDESWFRPHPTLEEFEYRDSSKKKMLFEMIRNFIHFMERQLWFSAYQH